MGCTVTAVSVCRPAIWRALSILVALGAGLVASAWAPPAVAVAQAEGIVFDAEVASFASPRDGFPRVEVHTAVPYAALQFVRRAEGFAGGYLITATVHRAGRNDSPEGLVLTRTWGRDLAAETFSSARDPGRIDRAAESLALPPGRYVISLRLEDGGSARSGTFDKVIEVPDFTRQPAISDILVADQFDPRVPRSYVNPASAVSTDQESFALFYEVYARQSDRMRVRYTVYELGTERRRAAWLMGLFGRAERETVTQVYEAVESATLTAGATLLGRSFRTDLMGSGDFEAVVQIERPDGTVVATGTRPFSVRWAGIFDDIQDLDTAIAALRHIARPAEVRRMQEAPTPQERLRLFQEFWDKRDPSPGSRRNERMEEYYFRVAHANRHYGRSGWNTDRGEVFIRFGEPDRIENHAADGSSRPHEIWYYNRMGRRFIFVEEGGTFRLLVPIWDERHRMR